MILAIHGGGAQDSSNKAHTATALSKERRVEQSIVEGEYAWDDGKYPTG